MSTHSSHTGHLQPEACFAVENLYSERTSLYHFIFMTLYRYHRQIENFLQKGAYVRSGMRVLDAGCGSGLVTKKLHGMTEEKHCTDMTFHGFDLTPAMLARFQTWIVENNLQNAIEVMRANVLDLQVLPEDWKDYDLIVSASMLEYIPKDQLPIALGNLAGRLNKDGSLLLFITKKNLITQYLVGKCWKANLFVEGEMDTLLRQIGFRTIVRKLFSGPYRYANYSTIALEARLSS